MLPNIIRNKLPPVDYDRIAFVVEHYEELKHMYFTIMEHLKIPDGGTGSSLWEEVEPITFVPLYITFQDTPQEVINNTTYCYGHYDDCKHMPLFKVEDNTYAIPIPFEELTDANQIFLCYAGTPYKLNNGHIALFEPEYINIHFVESVSGNLEKHNHAIVSGLNNYPSVYELTDKLEEFTFNRIKPIENRQVLGG